MNYLFRDAAIDFIAAGNIDAPELDGRLNAILAKYHGSTNHLLYNLLDSHDTPRFLEECGGDTAKLKLAAALQVMFPGSPALYYGDELGMMGKNDPDCRRCMAWEEVQNSGLLAWYKQLLSIRIPRRTLREGQFRTNFCESGTFGFVRLLDSEGMIYTLLNRGPGRKIMLPVLQKKKHRDLLTGRVYGAQSIESPGTFYNADLLPYAGTLALELPQWGVMILEPCVAWA
jgi:glycosidase